MTSDTKTKVQRNGQDTSWDAALLQTPAKSGVLYGRIRDALATCGPLTDEELEDYLRQRHPGERFTSSGIRSRRNELVLTGWVTKARGDDGQVLKREGSNGSPRIVWRSVAEGEQVAIPADNGERVKDAPADMLGAQGFAIVNHDAGVAAAERYALWNLGDPSWVRPILAAYMDPAKAHADLDADGAPR